MLEEFSVCCVIGYYHLVRGCGYDELGGIDVF